MRRLLLAVTGFAAGVAIAVVLSARQQLAGERTGARPSEPGAAEGSEAARTDA